MASWMDAPPTKDELAVKAWNAEPPSKEELGEKEEKILGGLLSKKTAQNWVNTLPTVGALGGGVAGTAAGPGWGTIGGAGLGAAAGKYLEGAAETYFDLPEKPKSRSEAHIAPLKEGLLSATGQGVGMEIGKGLAKRTATKAAEKVGGKLVQVGDDLVTLTPEILEESSKPSAPQIMEAAQRLGVKPTKGMISSDQTTRLLESGLSQKPSLAGGYVRRQYEPIYNALDEASQTVGGTSLTPFESGTEAKKLLMGKVSERLSPLKSSYDEIAESTAKSVIDPKSAERAATGLLKTPIASTSGTETNALAKKYSDMISSAKSPQDLQNIISEAKDFSRNSGGKLKLVADKAAKAGERLLRRGLIKSGQEAAGDEGVDVAKGLIQDLRTTNKGYRELARDIEKSLGGAKLGSNSPGDVIRGLDDAPAEQLAERLFNVKNVEGLKSLKDFDADAFETLRVARLQDIINKSSNYKTGKIDPNRLVQNISKLPKDAQELLLGDKIRTVEDIRTVIGAMPEKLGPSGTPQGQEVFNYLGKGQYAREARDAAQLLRLLGKSAANPTEKTAKNVGPKLLPQGIIGTSGLIRSRENR